MYICKFCEKNCKNKKSLSQHEIRCKENPNRIIIKSCYGMLGRKGCNQYLKAKELGIPKPILSEETKKKMSNNSKNKKHTEETKRKISKSIKEAIKNNPDSYTSSNRGRTKQISKYGIKFQGKWELYFYEWCIENNIKIERCKEWFSYQFEGNRKYNPDFYLEDLQIYIEVKGYKTERDEAKWNQFPKNKKLVKIMNYEIQQILNKNFKLGN